MGLRKALLIAAAAGVLLGNPAAARAATAQENLDCAIWASYRVGVAEDDQTRNAFMLAAAWFVGLYEGQAGKPIDEAMAARAPELSEAQIGALEGACIARFGNFGDRMTAVGERLSATGN